MNTTFAEHWLLAISMGLSLMVAWLFAAQAFWSLKHYRLRMPEAPLPSLKDLPTVTLAIPARNETHVLTECLTAAIASDYPKLEIIVLDDCSQDKTSSLIRAFAHDGVRFIQGDQPSDGWLGKNNAMQALTNHASGDYIVFADVDTRLEPTAISQLMRYMVTRQLQMVSVLAQRREGLHWGTALWQLKYYWQIVLPLIRGRVPVASQCWAINSDELRRLGGFAVVSQKVAPEGYFARQLFAMGVYRFLVANTALGVTTAKRWSSQNDTAIRLLYPACRRRLLVVLAAIGFLLLMLAPFVNVVYAVTVMQWSANFWVATLAVLLYMIGYILVVVRTIPRTWPLTALLFPASLVQEVVLLLVSTIRYKFGKVDWKGRNVCYPVLVDLPEEEFKGKK